QPLDVGAEPQHEADGAVDVRGLGAGGLVGGGVAGRPEEELAAPALVKRAVQAAAAGRVSGGVPTASSATAGVSYSTGVRAGHPLRDTSGLVWSVELAWIWKPRALFDVGGLGIWLLRLSRLYSDASTAEKSITTDEGKRRRSKVKSQVWERGWAAVLTVVPRAARAGVFESQ
ncbi:hypothetical protein THAOC_28811, partial [Thalassiosira oceanica]